MKKILSVVLAVCMLATACLSLTACSSVSVKKVKKDPVGTISTAFENAFAEFFEDDAGAEKILKKARKKGSVDILLASNDLMGGDLTEINEVIYLDQKNNAFVSDTKVIYDGHRYKATLWGNEDSLIFKSASILGTDDALSLNFDSFIKDFPESELFDYLDDLLGLTDENAEDIVAVVDALRGVMNGQLGTLSDKEADKLILQLADIFKQNVETEKTEDENGKKVNNIIVSYKVDNKKIDKAYELIVETFGDLGSDESVDELDLPVDIEADIFITINAKTNTVSTVKVRADISPIDTWTGEAGDPIQADLLCTFTEENITLTGKVKVDGSVYTVDAGIEKAKSGDKVIYDVYASFKTGNIRIEILDLSCAYNKKTGELTIDGSVALDEDESIDVELTATYTANKTEVVFDLGTIKVSDGGEVLFSFKKDDDLRIVIRPLEEIPAPDSNAIDIVTMDEDAVEDLFEGIAGSDAVALIMQLVFSGLM